MENATERIAKTADPTFGHNFLAEFLKNLQTWATNWGQSVGRDSLVQPPRPLVEWKHLTPEMGAKKLDFGTGTWGQNVTPRF